MVSRALCVHTHTHMFKHVHPTPTHTHTHSPTCKHTGTHTHDHTHMHTHTPSVVPGIPEGESGGSLGKQEVWFCRQEVDLLRKLTDSAGRTSNYPGVKGHSKIHLTSSKWNLRHVQSHYHQHGADKVLLIHVDSHPHQPWANCYF